MCCALHDVPLTSGNHYQHFASFRRRARTHFTLCCLHLTSPPRLYVRCLCAAFTCYGVLQLAFASPPTSFPLPLGTIYIIGRHTFPLKETLGSGLSFPSDNNMPSYEEVSTLFDCYFIAAALNRTKHGCYFSNISDNLARRYVRQKQTNPWDGEHCTLNAFCACTLSTG